MAEQDKYGIIHKRILSIVAFALSLVYVLYCAVYWGSVLTQMGVLGALAFNIVLPHLVCVGLGFVFTALALFMGKPAWSLVAGICYVLAIICFPGYWWAIIIQAVLSFVAFYFMRKDEAAQKAKFDADVDAEVAAGSVDDGDPADAVKDAETHKAAHADEPVEAPAAVETEERAVADDPIEDAVEAGSKIEVPVVETVEGDTTAGAEDEPSCESTTA